MHWLLVGGRSWKYWTGVLRECGNAREESSAIHFRIFRGVVWEQKFHAVPLHRLLVWWCCGAVAVDLSVLFKLKTCITDSFFLPLGLVGFDRSKSGNTICTGSTPGVHRMAKTGFGDCGGQANQR